jgi:hypothetical protein
LKNLDTINPSFARPSAFIALGSLLPLLTSLVGVGFAVGAAPDLAVVRNPVALFCLAISVASCAMLIIPRLMRWDWRAGYFGFSLLYILSISLIGGIPWLCLLVFSSASLWLRCLLFSLHALTLLWWAGRYASLYRKVFATDALRQSVYVEDDDCIYYLQKGDRMVLDKICDFKEFPPTLFVLSTLAVSGASMLYAGDLVAFFGLPYAHIFLAILGISVNMIGVGFAVRGWLIFYKYPRMLRRKTGKQVYVDMVSKPASQAKTKARA